MLKEFKAFLMRGNVVDLAVAVIIGGAFGAIVKSLVDDLISPLISMFGGAEGLAALLFTLNGAEFKYGNFLAAIINFVIVGFVLFLIVKAMNAATALTKKQEEEAPAAPPAPTQEELLTEIRDLLAKK